MTIRHSDRDHRTEKLTIPRDRAVPLQPRGVSSEKMFWFCVQVPFGRVCHSSYKCKPKDTDLVGYKAANLGALLEAGFPVLNGICITTSAFRFALDPHIEKIGELLQKYDQQKPADAVVVSSQIMSVLDQLRIPEIVVAELDHLLPTIAEPTMPLAIRSSATAEAKYLPL